MICFGTRREYFIDLAFLKLRRVPAGGIPHVEDACEVRIAILRRSASANEDPLTVTTLQSVTRICFQQRSNTVFARASGPTRLRICNADWISTYLPEHGASRYGLSSRH
jgi:hypothetical protein